MSSFSDWSCRQSPTEESQARVEKMKKAGLQWPKEEKLRDKKR